MNNVTGSSPLRRGDEDPRQTTMGPVAESPPTARVSMTHDGDAVVLTVDGRLDVRTGEALVAAVSDAVEAGTTRLDIDLSGIVSFDDRGASALLACRDLAASVEGGLHYRTSAGGAGQEVLLHAYATEG
jgi:hypothetical protein